MITTSNVSENYEALQSQTARAIQDYQSRMIGNSTSTDELNALFQFSDHLTIENEAVAYEDLTKAFLSLLINPAFSSRLPDSVRDGAGERLIRLMEFFAAAKHNTTIESEIALQIVTQHWPDADKLDEIRDHYNSGKQ